MGLSVRRIVAVAGEHVVDSLGYSHRSTMGTGGLVSGGQGITQQIFLILELGHWVIQAASMRDKAAAGVVSNQSAHRLRPAHRS
jgi:hypothetical protein